MQGDPEIQMQLCGIFTYIDQSDHIVASRIQKKMYIHGSYWSNTVTKHIFTQKMLQVTDSEKCGFNYDVKTLRKLHK